MKRLVRLNVGGFSRVAMTFKNDGMVEPTESEPSLSAFCTVGRS